MADGTKGLVKSKEDIENITNILVLSGNIETIEMEGGCAYIAEIEPQVLLVHIPDDIETAQFIVDLHHFGIKYSSYRKPIKHFYITGLRSVTLLNQLFYQLNYGFHTEMGTAFDFSYANVENLQSIRLADIRGRRIIFGDAVVHDGFHIWCGYSAYLDIQHPKVNGHADLEETARNMSGIDHLCGVTTLRLENLEVDDAGIE